MQKCIHLFHISQVKSNINKIYYLFNMNKGDSAKASLQSVEEKTEVVQRVGMTTSSRKIQRTSQQVSQTNTPIKSQQRQSQQVQSSTGQKKQENSQSASQKVTSPRYSRTSGTQSVTAFQSQRSTNKLVQQQSRQALQEPEKKKETAKRNIVRIAERHARYKLIDGFNGLRLNYFKTSISGYKTVKLLDIGNKIIFRWKNHGWIKLLQNRNLFRKREQVCKRIVFIFNSSSLRIRRLVLQKMRGNSLIIKSREALSADQTPSKTTSRANQKILSPNSLKNSKQSQIYEGAFLEKMVLSQEAIVPLKKCQKYDRRTFFELSSTQLKQAFEAEKRRLQQIRNSDKSLKGRQFDNELLIVVLLNHVTALLHFNDDKEKLQKKLAVQAQNNTNNLSIQIGNSRVSATTKEQGGSFNAGMARKYEQTSRQIEASDQEIRVLLDERETDYDELVRVLRAQVQKFKRNKNDKIVLSRIHLSEIIINLVANLSKGQVPTHKQMTQHHYVELVDELVNKVKELSTISEQIPQLQTFKRNLDLTQVSHEQHFIRIVDVLIALHHRVNQLLRLRPEDMMTVIDSYRNECRNIDNLTQIFIENAESQTEELQSIIFNPKKGSHIQQFYPLHRNITIISKLLIKERDYCIKSQQIIERLKVVVEIFWNVMSGLKSFEREWRIAKANTDVSDVQKQILLILDECLQIFNDRLIIVEKRAQQAEQMLQRKKNQTSLYHQKLETEINALLSDFQSVTLKNEELEQFVNRLMNQKEELANQLKSQRAPSQKTPKHQKNKKSDAEIEKMQRQNSELRSELSKLKSQLTRKSKQTQRFSRQSSHQFERRIAVLEDENQHLIKERDLNKAKNNELNQRLIVTTQQVDTRGYEIDRLNRNLESLRTEYQQYENKTRITIRDFQTKNIEYRSQSETLREELRIMEVNHRRIVEKYEGTTIVHRQTNLEEQFGKIQGRLNIALSEEGKYKLQLARLKEENIQLNKRLDQQWSNQSAASELNILLREKHSLEERLRMSSYEIQGLKEKIDAFCGENQGNLDDIQRALRQKQYEIKTLRAENEANMSKIRTLNLIIQQNKNASNPEYIKQLQVLRIQLRDFAIFKQQNQSYRNKFIKDQAYILYLEEQVRSLEDVVNVLSEEQNTLSQQYTMLSTKLRYLNQGKSITFDSSKDQQIQRLKMQIAELRSSGIKRITEHTQIIQQGVNKQSTYISQQQSSTTTEITNLHGQIKSLNGEISNLLNKESALQAQIDHLKGVINNLQLQFHERENYFNSQIVQMQVRVNQSSGVSQNHVMQAQLRSLKDQLRNKDQELIHRRINDSHWETDIRHKEEQLIQAKNQIHHLEQQFLNIERDFSMKQQGLINQIRRLRQILDSTTIHHQRQFIGIRRQDHENVQINGATLEQLIQTTDVDNPIILDKINEIVRENTISYDLQRVMSPQIRKDVEGFIMINQTLIDLTVNLTSDRERMLSILRNYPNPEHLTEFLFRTLIDFAGIPDQTLQANQVLDTLFGIRESRRGGQYFIGLQQFVNAFFQHDILPRRLDQVRKPVTETHYQVNVIRSQDYHNGEHQ